VWAANGDHCAYCGKSRDLCERLGIGLTVQHIRPVVFGGAVDSSLIPFCSRCQQGSTAALAETRGIERAILGSTHQAKHSSEEDKRRCDYDGLR
jgi:hypothetical protein